MTTKRQHFVPRFYLKHFTNDEGKLHAFRQADKTHFVTTPERVFAENYLYEAKHLARKITDDNNGLKYLSNYTEDKLAKAEDKLATRFNQLIDCCERRDFETDEYDDGRLIACVLAASLIVRHPRMLEQDRSQSKRIAKSLVDNNVITNDVLNRLEQEGLDDYLEDICEIGIMQGLLFSGDRRTPLVRLCNSFAEKKMTVVQAPTEMGFVTASMPLNLFDIDVDAYDFQMAYLPLTSKYAALFTTSNEVVEFCELTVEETVDFNMMLLANDLWDTAVSRSERSLTAAVNKLQGLKNTLESTAD